MNKPDLPLVIVQWDDAHFNDEGISLEGVGESHKPEAVTTIGWVLRDDAVGLTVACEYYDGYYRRRTFIPRGMVTDVTPYSLRKRRAHPKEIDE